MSDQVAAENEAGARRTSTPSSALSMFAMLAVALAGALAFETVTHGFTALTSETARRAAVLESPVLAPELLGADQTGRVQTMLADPGHAGAAPRVAIVDFVYTRCETLCSALGSSYQQLQAEIGQRHLEDKVRLLTVSFDPAHDTPAELAQYASRMRADPAIWTLLSPANPQQLRRVLAVFGIVVVPAPPGQFLHKSAFHLLDARGRLVRIVDADKPHLALDAAFAIASMPGPTR